jgi:hypothetical protein
MKKIILFFSILSLAGKILLANGVVINKAEVNSYLTLIESLVNVTIESQVSNTVTAQIFRNDIGDSLAIKYAFPLPDNASATKLRYKINGLWYTANFAPVPQDTTTGGSSGEEDYILNQYLGSNPLYFDIHQKINKDSSIIVELTYVELLKYKFGNVKYLYPNNYQLIQTGVLTKQEINVVLNSERTIENIELLSHTATSKNNTGNQATLSYIGYELAANTDYNIQYSLSLNELGLYSLSTYLPDSLQKDAYGRGFFAVIVEPDPSENTDVIDKIFTLIIDNSGSMGGEKIIQARNAAKFIVENLNEGDKFNIISFSTEVTTFRANHVDYNITNQESAIAYINSLEATELTNISGAFDMAIPQFSAADSNSANIIIFFTDGEQTTGIIDTDELINHINNLIMQSEKQISLFTFGIGDYTNEQLLTTIANNNNGASEYLKNNELEVVLTDFYLMIRNPVLLNTEIEFSPSIISQIYPSLLPNLYKGQQMILIGRYNEPSELITTLKGNAFSNPVEYEYSTVLSDSLNSKFQFLTKLWAKEKIDDLMDQYYLNLNNSIVSEGIKSEIVNISLTYGVISPFTSFQGGDPDYTSTNTEWEILNPEWNKSDELSNEYIKVESIYPNPCYNYLNIIITSKDNFNGILSIKLVNSKGQLIYNLSEYIQSQTTYEYNIDLRQLNLSSGVYFILIQYKNRTITCKVIIE